MNLFDTFPVLSDGIISIHQMHEDDVTSLMKLTNNPNMYRFATPLLRQKTEEKLLVAIRNAYGYDFEKKKHILAGIYEEYDPNHLVGLVKIVDYKKRKGDITIEYCVSEENWNKKYATRAIALLKDYLFKDSSIMSIHAYVMEENEYSIRALKMNHFVQTSECVTQKKSAGLSDMSTIHFVSRRH